MCGCRKFFERCGLWREERTGDGSLITVVCFEHIEDFVADIAVIFNWSPAEIFTFNVKFIPKICASG
nr:GpE family phage tail protein [Escherichia coli]